MWRSRPAPKNRKKQQISPGRSQTHRAKAEAICSWFTWYSAYLWPLVPVAGDGLFLTVHSLSYFVETLFASWRLPPWAADPASVRASSVWGHRERRPWFVQSRRNVIRHGKRAAARRLFFFCRRPADFTNHCSFCLIQEVEQMKSIELQLAHQYSTMVYIWSYHHVHNLKEPVQLS